MTLCLPVLTGRVPGEWKCGNQNCDRPPQVDNPEHIAAGKVFQECRGHSGPLVGRALKRLIKWGRLSPKGGCGACDDFADQMDRWGVEGCQENMAKIIDRLRAGAAEHGYPFWDLAGLLLVRVAISKAITVAAAERIRWLAAKAGCPLLR